MADDDDLRAKVAFLESLTLRLSQELSAKVKSGTDVEAESRAVLRDLPMEVQTPEWLVSMDILSPVLAAFDGHVSDLRATMQEGESRYAALQEKAFAITRENQALQEQVLDLTEQVSAKVEYGRVGESAVGGKSEERIGLLEKENDLLREQNVHIADELRSVHEQLEESKVDVITLREENSSLVDRYQSVQKESNSLKARIIESEDQLERLSQREAARSAGETSDAAGASPVLEDPAAGLSVQKEEIEKRQLKVTQLQQENMQLMEELSEERALVSATASEAEDVRKQLVMVSELASQLEARNTELQTKEFEMASQTQGLRDAILEESAKLEISEKIRQQMKAEIAALSARLTRKPDDVRSKLKDQYEGRLSVAEAAQRQMEELVQSLRNDLSHWKVIGERYKRDADMYQSQLAEFQKMTVENPDRISGLLKKVQACEKERDDAVHKASGVRSEIKQSERRFERELRSLRQEKENMANLLTVSREVHTKLLAQVGQMDRDLAASIEKAKHVESARKESEHTMIKRLHAQRAESEEALAHLQKRLEAEVEARKAAEAPGEKALGGSASIDTYIAEAHEAKLRAEGYERQLHTEGITHARKVDVLSRENTKLEEQSHEMAKHIAILTAQCHEAQACLSEAESELIVFRERLKAAIAKEAQLMQEKDEVVNAAELLKLETSKAKRAHAAALRKVDYLKSQYESLHHQSAVSVQQPVEIVQ